MVKIEETVCTDLYKHLRKTAQHLVKPEAYKFKSVQSKLIGRSIRCHLTKHLHVVAYTINATQLSFQVKNKALSICFASRLLIEVADLNAVKKTILLDCEKDFLEGQLYLSCLKFCSKQFRACFVSLARFPHMN